MIIRAPSRLHMSLIDMNGSYKRIDGGIGLALSDPQFVLESEETNEKGYTLEFADGIRQDSIEECQDKIPKAAEKIAELCDIESGFHFKVLEAYPAHSGLGSGTQISVCTAHLMTATAGLEFSSRDLSAMVGRGGTSGIGTFAHDLGGFIVDGGHSLEEKPGFLPSSASKAKPATLIARYEFPEEWDILLAMPEVEQVSHLILMNLLPFLLEKDIVNFGWAIKELQKVGFNKLEHSLDPHYLPTMQALDDAGAYGTGISSFGPTLYTVFDENNKDIVKAAEELVGKDRVKVTKAQNHGYVIEK
ncbi:MAG: hypothetical protein J6V44_05600 [Methanobrevibacter sp.]|nr:hypothetical protein [Methanobrevibacter sp.]